MAYTYLIAGEFEHREGDLDLAHDRYTKALDLAGEAPPPSDDLPMGRGHIQAVTMSRIAVILEQRGELAEAHALLQRAAALGSHTKDGPIMSRCADGVASFLVAEGHPVRAAEMLGASHTMRGAPSIDAIIQPRVRDQIVDAIGESAYEAAYESGRRLTRDEAFALGQR